MGEASIREAILSSLAEERVSKSRIIFRGIFWGSALALLTILALHFFSQSVFASNEVALCASIWMLMVVGLCLVFWPQPRIQPRGYWGALSYGRLLVGMTFVTALQLIICPEFASMAFHSAGPIPLIQHLTHFYMSFGGMAGCMFLCGLTFTGLGAFVTFRVLERAFFHMPTRKIPGILGLSLLGQTPVILMQLLNESGRETFAYWVTGSFIALLLGALLIRRPWLQS